MIAINRFVSVMDMTMWLKIRDIYLGLLGFEERISKEITIGKIVRSKFFEI
jgi:hypothetical protein